MTAKEIIIKHLTDYIKNNFNELVEFNSQVDKELITEIKKGDKTTIAWFLQEVYIKHCGKVIPFIEHDDFDSEYFEYILTIDDKLIAYKDVYKISYNPEFYFVKSTPKTTYVYERI